MKKLRIDDEVLVIAGKFKQKTGKVVKIYEKRNRVLVKGINLVKKAVRPTQENPNGGFLDMETPIHRSNIMVISPKTKKRTRVRCERKEGKNVRVAVSCGSAL